MGDPFIRRTLSKTLVAFFPEKYSFLSERNMGHHSMHGIGERDRETISSKFFYCGSTERVLSSSSWSLLLSKSKGLFSWISVLIIFLGMTHETATTQMGRDIHKLKVQVISRTIEIDYECFHLCNVHILSFFPDYEAWRSYRIWKMYRAEPI